MKGRHGIRLRSLAPADDVEVDGEDDDEPVTTICHSCGTDRIRRPLVSMLMMNAPMMVPRIVPSPPLSDVPPMTTAAMASSS